MAAMEGIHVCDVPNNHEQIQDNNAATTMFSNSINSSTRLDKEDQRKKKERGNLKVIGHRGSGMNILQSYDQRMKCYKENSIRSFNHAARLNLDFVEFDVQVTKDDCPVLFHDIHIATKHEGTIMEKRVTDLTIEEFLSYGPQKDPSKVGKPLLRRAKDGRIFDWIVEIDDPLCTLEEAFCNVDNSLGFNIELKFDDNKVYDEIELTRILQAVFKVVDRYANGRPIIFSSFQPDAAQLMTKLQDTYPVFFLTNGGCEIYPDPRRNSLEEAIKLCTESRLQGIVSQVKAILRNSTMVAKIKESNLSLMTYGHLNNVPEVVYLQHLIGVDGVVVDFVQEIAEAVSQFEKAADEEAKLNAYLDQQWVEQIEESPIRLSQHEQLIKLRPEMVQT